MTLLAILLGVAAVDLLLLSRATKLLSRLAFLPLARPRRIEVPDDLAKKARTEPGEAGYREAPVQRIDVQQLPWPRDLHTPNGRLQFHVSERAITMRTKWAGRQIPAIGRIDVRGDRDGIELAARFTPSPLTTLLFVAMLVHSLVGEASMENVLYAVVLVAMHVIASIVELRRQLEHAQMAFETTLEEEVTGQRIDISDDDEVLAEQEQAMQEEREHELRA